MQILNKIHLNSSIFSRIFISSSISTTDPSNFSSLLGYRQSLFSLVNPTLFQYSLKTCFLFLESFLRAKYSFVFVGSFSNPILFNRFSKICKGKNFYLLKDTETSAGFLTNNVNLISNTVVITLFLNSRKTELIQKEAFLLKIPTISFSDLSANRFSSTIFIGGNYSSFLAQNLILSLISVCIQQKYE
jgi:hypothetical protein